MSETIYDAIIVRPSLWFSRTVLWKVADIGIIDGAGVNGSAKLMRGFGWIGSRLQSGQIGTYVVFFVIGALLVLGAILTG